MWKKLIVISALATLALGVAACSDDDDDSEATPTPSVCDAQEAVQQSVADLANIEVLAEGTDALDAAVESVNTELEDLKEAVSADVEDEVQALEDAVTDADETLSGIDDDATLNEKIDDVQSALTGIATAASALGMALENECS